MHVIQIEGRDVSVKSPTGAEYRFAGYGDYAMQFAQHEVAAVCHALQRAGVVTTAATLTDAVLAVRRHWRETLMWEAQIGTVRAPVVRYADFSEVDPNNAPYMSKMWQRVILVRLPHGKGHLFAHDVARLESEAADVQPK